MYQILMEPDLAGDSNVKGFATSNSIFHLLNRDKCKNAQEIHKNSKQTCETHQTAPLAVDCTPTLKSALQNHQRTKNLCETRVHYVCVN